MSQLFFPNNLKSLPIWILWKLEKDKDGRLTKVPYAVPYNGRASSTNPSTWSSFNRALRKFEANGDRYAGIGIVLSEVYGITFLDIDHCVREDGSFDERATELLKLFEGTYAERSQSGKGVHVLAFGTIPRNFNNRAHGVEMYSGGRFCAMTGDAIFREEIADRQEAIDFAFGKYSPTERQTNAHLSSPITSLSRSDSWIVSKARESSSKFGPLYDGAWTGLYPSHSEADVALCSILAFWTDADPVAIDRIFRSSALYREKWERADYRDSTIERACGYIDETLSEYVFRVRMEEGRKLENALISQW